VNNQHYIKKNYALLFTVITTFVTLLGFITDVISIVDSVSNGEKTKPIDVIIFFASLIIIVIGIVVIHHIIKGKLLIPENLDKSQILETLSDKELNSYLLKKMNYTPALHLSYDKRTGQLFNKTKIEDASLDERQVLLRVKTFNELLFGIYEYESLKDPKPVNEDEINKIINHCNGLIKNCGYKCGANFADKYKNHFTKDVDKISSDIKQLKTVLRRWCVFDGNAGLGKFIITNVSKKNSATHNVQVNISVTLREDYVSYSKARYIYFSDKKFIVYRCQFMKGYIEGVCDELSKEYFSNYKFKVISCNKEQCRYENSDNSECKYKIIGTEITVSDNIKTNTPKQPEHSIS
jgi:hypothetical protein